MWGQAVGDALGTTVEFNDELGIATREPTAWPTELIGEGPFHLLPGQVTDDTELALALARSLVRRGRYDEDDVAEAYVRWRHSGPFDVGSATHQAFGGARPPGPGVALALRARANQQTQANGSLMRASPLGIFGAGMPRQSLARLAESDSGLSHPDQVCRAACAVFVTTIAEAIDTGLPGPELFARACDAARGSAVEDTLQAASSALPVSDGDNMGWVRIALQHAFFHLLHTTNFEAGLIQTVVKGGDSDTNGAITGALLGAVLGEAAIPARWRQAVFGCASPRPAEYRCSDLGQLAADLVAQGSGSFTH